MKYVDTHCHIQFNTYKDEREAVVRRNLERGVIMNVVGTQMDTSKAAVELAEQYDHVYATIGTHPTHLFPTYVDEEETSFKSRNEDFDEAFYTELVQSKKVIAIGETGLDLYHLPKTPSREEVLEKQTKVFLQHVDFAQKHDLPLVVHCRDAHLELLESLKSSGFEQKLRGVIHCFTGNWEFAQQYLNLGFYLGFTGVITYPPKKTDPKPQEELLEVLRNMPLDRMLVETDAPYLAPQAYRGERSEPWMVEEQVKFLAGLRGLSSEEMSNILFQNSSTLFSLLYEQ